MSTYIKYSAIKGLKHEVLTSEDGHAIVKFSGTGVWQAFKNEPGKHCVQRVPPTERSGRRQTSIISVAVLPLPPENKEEPLREQDLEIKTQCGHGPGGQHQNKTASAVRITCKKTKLSVFINGRCQHQNKKEALRILAAKINQLTRNENKKQYIKIKSDQMKDQTQKIGNRGKKRRTYNFIRGEVIDHTLNKKTNKIKEFMKGDFSVLFK